MRLGWRASRLRASSYASAPASPMVPRGVPVRSSRGSSRRRSQSQRPRAKAAERAIAARFPTMRSESSTRLSPVAYGSKNELHAGGPPGILLNARLHGIAPTVVAVFVEAPSAAVTTRPSSSRISTGLRLSTIRRSRSTRGVESTAAEPTTATTTSVRS
jgi:hypothetical protein